MNKPTRSISGLSTILILSSIMVSCSCQKNEKALLAKRTLVFKYDTSRFAYRGCLQLDSKRDLPQFLYKVLDKDIYSKLIQERTDFLEVARVASREISYIDEELAQINSTKEVRSKELEENKRIYSAEINHLWNKAVSVVDQRFAERARRFQVMLSDRMKERGVQLFPHSNLLEPHEAAQIFERESRNRGYWNEDELWLKQQIEAWKIYEDLWRLARVRIRKEIEKVRTESSAKIVELEEILLRQTERASLLNSRKEQMAKPLKEAFVMLAQVELKILQELLKCSDELYQLCNEVAECVVNVTDGLLYFHQKSRFQKYVVVVFEDSTGLPNFAIISPETNTSNQNTIPLTIRPIVELLRVISR